MLNGGISRRTSSENGSPPTRGRHRRRSTRSRCEKRNSTTRFPEWCVVLGGGFQRRSGIPSRIWIEISRGPDISGRYSGAERECAENARRHPRERGSGQSPASFPRMRESISSLPERPSAKMGPRPRSGSGASLRGDDKGRPSVSPAAPWWALGLVSPPSCASQ
jgi:hypothetical protein